jgi:hypothetical protein
MARRQGGRLDWIGPQKLGPGARLEKTCIQTDCLEEFVNFSVLGKYESNRSKSKCIWTQLWESGKFLHAKDALMAFQYTLDIRVGQKTDAKTVRRRLVRPSRMSDTVMSHIQLTRLAHLLPSFQLSMLPNGSTIVNKAQSPHLIATC